MKAALLASDLMPPATFARRRARLQAEILVHREDRFVQLGPHAALIFESDRTVRFRLQEILRVEAISGDEAVQAEIDACAALLPGGRNFKATLRLEFADAGERARGLAQLAGVENYVWMQVEGAPRIYAIADQDPGRCGGDAAQHVLRFELDDAIVRELRHGRPLAFGIDHPSCVAREAVGENVRQSLLGDLR